MGGTEVIAVWFRKGLRLHDNYFLTQAKKDGKNIIPFFIEEDPYPRALNRYRYSRTKCTNFNISNDV